MTENGAGPWGSSDWKTWLLISFTVTGLGKQQPLSQGRRAQLSTTLWAFSQVYHIGGGGFFGFFLFVCLAGFSLIQPLRIEVRSKLKRGSGCKLPLGFIAFQFLEYFGSCVHWAITSSRCHANSVECLSMLCTEGSFPHYSVLTKASA